MKTRAQKGEELAKAKILLDKSQALIFADFTKISAEDIRRLRMELAKSNAKFMVIKKRLLGLLLKEKGIEADLRQFKVSVGTIFSEGDTEKVAGPAYAFFSKLEVPEGGDKAMWVKKLLGGYDMKTSALVDAQQIIHIGKLPPREVVLAQLLGMLAAPIRSFMYLLDQKAKAGATVAATPAAVAEKPAATEEAKPVEPTTPKTEPESKVELTQAQ